VTTTLNVNTQRPKGCSQLPSKPTAYWAECLAMKTRMCIPSSITRRAALHVLILETLRIMCNRFFGSDVNHSDGSLRFDGVNEKQVVLASCLVCHHANEPCLLCCQTSVRLPRSDSCNNNTRRELISKEDSQLQPNRTSVTPFGASEYKPGPFKRRAIITPSRNIARSNQLPLQTN
jgi:hypothetical protein